MGQFLNPDNTVFQDEIKSTIYVDKTGLISFTNSVCSTSQRFICSSRPRRFGKSYAADMLTAYYSRGCNSLELFKPYKIAEDPSFKKYLNQSEVIRFDVQWCRSASGSAAETTAYINDHIILEMKDAYPEVDLSNIATAFEAMNAVNIKTGKKFVVIIDEWDALIRDDANDRKIQDEYIDFLRGMFKGTEPLHYIELAYITGILPIKRMKTQSSLNNFYEYTMTASGALSEFIGFTDKEVKDLCVKHHADYQEIRRWYDGYLLQGWQIYNPNSVCRCIFSGNPGDYWTSTASFDSIRPYINMNFNGLKDELIEMISGIHVKVNVSTFENHTDKAAFKSKDDVFTYLIHLGYLAYDQVKKEAYVPNEEIRMELGAEVSENHWDEFKAFEKESLNLFTATINHDEETVAAGIEKIHDQYASSIWYNNENSLAAVISIGYLCTLKYYFKPVREMPAGKGFADLVYIPRPEYINDLPALIIELKWHHDAETALDQIRRKQYPESLKDYTGDILEIGIHYDLKTKKHTCRIENA